MKMKRKMGRVTLKVNRTSMYWLNPTTNNLVCYARAQQLHLLNKKGIKHGIKDPKTNQLISPLKAIQLGLVDVKK